MTRTTIALAAGIAALTIAGTACGDNGRPGPPAANAANEPGSAAARSLTPAGHTIILKLIAFAPPQIDVPSGTTVTVTQLKAYAKEFGTTLNSVNDQLPAEAVEAAIAEHATTLLAVIDAQAAKDPAKAATALRSAVGHMSMTAKAIAGATYAKFPEKF